MHAHSRRGFLAQTLGASWLGASLMEKAVLRAAQVRAESRSSPQPILFDIEKLADGIYAALARPQPQVNCNAVIFENADDILIVDAHSKSSAVAASGRADPQADYVEAGTLRREYAFSLGPHPGQSYLPENRSPRRHRFQHHHSQPHCGARRHAVQSGGGTGVRISRWLSQEAGVRQDSRKRSSITS